MNEFVLGTTKDISNSAQITIEEKLSIDHEMDKHIIGLTMTLTLAGKIDHEEYILKLHTIENVCSVEEII